MKGIKRFGKKSKLSSRHVGHFEAIERIDITAYMLQLSYYMSNIHNVFDMSLLRK